MNLVQILLPVHDNSGVAFPPELYAKVHAELTDRFGGLTAFMRAPAQGLWKEEDRTVHDDIVVLEIMTAELDMVWWRDYRQSLETSFRQDTIIIRAQKLQLL